MSWLGFLLEVLQLPAVIKHIKQELEKQFYFIYAYKKSSNGKPEVFKDSSRQDEHNSCLSLPLQRTSSCLSEN